MKPANLIELWRGGLREGVHQGHAVICDTKGVISAWGDPSAVIFPRSSCKMIQALPLLETGAADAARLTGEQYALACASHNGGQIHVQGVDRWLKSLGLSERDLRCGAHMPKDRDENRRLTCSGVSPCQLHNNCSGKHAGFLTLNRHLGGGTEYIELEHPVQQAIKAASEEVTGETSPGHGIDGCSAPNFACTVTGLARAMAAFAQPGPGLRGQAMTRLVQAMCAFPELVAGQDRACTDLMRAMGGRVAVKTGAEAVYVAIAPDKGLGIALKVLDGGTRASEAAITALLVHLGLLDAGHPVVAKYLGVQTNWRGMKVAELRTAEGFPT